MAEESNESRDTRCIIKLDVEEGSGDGYQDQKVKPKTATQNRGRGTVKVVILATLFIALSLSVIALLVLVERVSHEIGVVKLRVDSLEQNCAPQSGLNDFSIQMNSSREEITTVRAQVDDHVTQLAYLGLWMDQLNRTAVSARNCHVERRTCQLLPLSLPRFSRHCYTPEVKATMKVRKWICQLFEWICSILL